METFRVAYAQHAFAFWLLLAVAVLLVAAWTFFVNRRTRGLEARFQSIFAETAEQGTHRMLVDYLGTVRRTAGTVEEMRSEHEQLMTMMPTAIRHVGLVRFSPFHDTGGDQSFALALLDGLGDGVVVTGLHSRTDSRLYAKPIQRGSSEYALTPEEREAMDRAFRRQAVEAPV